MSIRVLTLVFAHWVLSRQSLNQGSADQCYNPPLNRRSAAPTALPPPAAAAAAGAQALERSGRAKRGRAAAGRAFDLYLAGSASGRQIKNERPGVAGGGRTKWVAKGWRA